MKLKLLSFIVFLSITQLFAVGKTYQLNIVSAFCKVSEYEQIANASQSELAKFFNNDKYYKIIGEDYELTGLNFLSEINPSKLLKTSIVQEFKSTTSTVDPKLKEVFEDIGYRHKSKSISF